MPISLPSAVKLLERGDYEGAETALASLVGASRDGVIARFRRAECLSRLGRHGEAVAEARQAHADGGGEAPPALWLAHTLAEARLFDEAAAVALPATSVESLDFLRDGFRAVARIAAGDREGAENTVKAVLDTRHVPIYSLALRETERDRLAGETRAPDLPSVWFAIDCGLEMEYDGLTEHEPVPTVPDSGFSRAEAARHAARWIRMHCSCGDYSMLIKRIRWVDPVPADLDEAELENLLSLGRLDQAHELAEKLAKEAGADAAGELAIDRARIAQMRGEPARVRDFAGHEDAEKRLAQTVAWLDMNAAILRGDDIAARALADDVADPAKREFVEAALHRWKDAVSDS